MNLIKGLLILVLIIIIAIIFFLKNIISLIGPNFFNIDNNNANKIINLNDAEEVFNIEEKSKTYSLLDLWDQNNIDKLKNTADFINTKGQDKTSIINIYSEKIINAGENIINNTITDAKNKVENNINNDIINDNIRSHYLNNIKDKTVIGNNIKENLIQKTSFVDKYIEDIKNFLDKITYKKEEILK